MSRLIFIRDEFAPLTENRYLIWNTVSSEGDMDQEVADSVKLPTFGRRKLIPHVCVVDAKQHIRTFLIESLEELGFATSECAGVSTLGAALNAQVPDLLVVGMSAGGNAACEALELLVSKQFNGSVLLFGPRGSAMITAVHEYGQKLGLVMLPILATPFGIENLREKVARLLPTEGPPSPAVHVAEALNAGWLELWYQPKFDMRTFSLSGAEALIRMRHPTWGIVPPAYFIPDDRDPHFRALSEFVIDQAAEDWAYFLSQYGHLEIAINMPLSFLREESAVKNLCGRIPNHPAFEGLIIEVNGIEIIRDLKLMRDRARQLRFYDVAISVDDLGEEWPSLLEMTDFPFAEIKVDKKFVAGCADDKLKQSVCRRILDLADGFGARTVAEGVESRADFLAVQNMGFDIVQGYLLAKPMMAKKLARTTLCRPNMPQGLAPASPSLRH